MRSMSTRPIAPWLVFAILGSAWTLLSITGIVPVAWLAETMSSTPPLSTSFKLHLARGQATVGVLFLFAATICAPGLRGRIHPWPKACHKRTFLLLCGVTAGIISLGLQTWLFSGIPHVTDATCHWFQARILASGSLFATAPECHEHFYQHNMIMTSDGKWFARYPPGTAAMLCLGIWLGIPWLIMPALFAFSAVACYFLMKAFLPESAARGATLLYVGSPLALLLSASYMSHLPFMAFCMGGLAAFIHATKRAYRTGKPDRRLAAAAGLMLGMAGLTRPQDLVLVGCVGALCSLCCPRSTWPALLRTAVRVVPWLVPAAAITAGLNHVYYGNPLALGYGFSESRRSNARHPGATWLFGNLYAASGRRTVCVGARPAQPIPFWVASIVDLRPICPRMPGGQASDVGLPPGDFVHPSLFLRVQLSRL